MPGYANRLVTRHYPNLSEPGDDVHVVLRNPRVMPTEELIPDVPEPAALPESEQRQMLYQIAAKLIVGGRLYDATVAAEDQPLLDYPVTAKQVSLFPIEIIKDLNDLINEVINPT